jgi:uncharacterized protein (DUF697 family)/tellurite resistance protein
MKAPLPTLTADEQRALIGLCLLAAHADGTRSATELPPITALLERLRRTDLDLEALGNQVRAGELELGTLARSLLSPGARELAYELALGVCDADGAASGQEQAFLEELRERLGLELARVRTLDRRADELASAPVSGEVARTHQAQLDELIQKHALLAGALELLPGTLDTLAILGVQMKLVHTIGKRHGHELDRGHIKDFLAVLGVGMTAQVLEGYLRKLAGGLFGRLAGGLVGGLAGGAVGPAMSFATTYALGHAAQRYYAGGRKLSALELKELFGSFFARGREFGERARPEIARRASELGPGDVLGLLR